MYRHILYKCTLLSIRSVRCGIKSMRCPLSLSSSAPAEIVANLVRKMQRFVRSPAVGAIRQLSTKAAAAPAAAVDHNPPKKIPGINGRYAGAVYTAASKIGMLERVEGELFAFTEAMKKSPGFQYFLKNPTVSRGDKVKEIGIVFTEEKFTHITRNLLLTLSANGRIDDVDKVISDFDDMMKARKGVVKATIISAEPLKKKNLDVISSAIVDLAGVNKTIELELKVDESILGGLQILVGDKFLDLSVRNRLASYEHIFS